MIVSKKYRNIQKQKVAGLFSQKSIFGSDSGGGVIRGKEREYAVSDYKHNFFPPIVSHALEYFKRNKISWWGGFVPSAHTLSSQIACLNHLFAVRCDQAEVLKIARLFNPDFIDVIAIETDQAPAAYIQFESVSDIDRLNEKTVSRGSNCTSVDALIYALHKDGQKFILPIEWKYTEEYGNESKADGDKGKTRKSRYTELINSSKQLQSQKHDIYYYEPFYQLMRQTLWAEQLIKSKDSETIKADDFIHIHVIPPENADLLARIYPCTGKDMEQTWRGQLKDQTKYIIISPRALLSRLDRQKYKALTEYLEKRYW